ncbi:MAG: DUF1361 domain-containing protein [Geodermatophilaceae bacterium]|nr:DUF1361 domain-containing protein [Geodermatophilaceae bacterium]
MTFGEHPSASAHADARPYTSSEIQARAVALGALLLAALFPVGILAFRMARFDALTYSFLVWNLFLAGIPVAFAVLAELAWRCQRRFLTIGLLGGWLAFFPNAPYITTDLVHLRERAPVPVWLDALILTSAALAGLLAGFVSLHIVQQMAEDRLGMRWGWALCATVLTVASFGVYVGRFARFNSWDLLTAPHEILYDVTGRVADPLSGLTALAVTLSFTALQLVSYVVIRSLGRLRSLGAAPPGARRAR